MISLVSDCIWEPVLGVWGTDYILSVIPKKSFILAGRKQAVSNVKVGATE